MENSWVIMVEQALWRWAQLRSGWSKLISIAFTTTCYRPQVEKTRKCTEVSTLQTRGTMQAFPAQQHQGQGRILSFEIVGVKLWKCHNTDTDSRVDVQINVII